MPVKVETTTLPGVLTLRPNVHLDDRGFFTRTWDAGVAREAGLPEFVQDSQSRSEYGVIRALHLRVGGGESKLVRCSRGRIVSFVVDLRQGSPTFGAWESFILDDVDHVSLFIPRGCAHGTQSLSDPADVCYKIDREHDCSQERVIAYDEPTLALPWPEPPTRLSERDRCGSPLAEVLREVAGTPPWQTG